ncbi:MAG: flagellar motor switch protein FliN [Alphaproteobacteria bacterium]|nr:flagellar motor switch protein FliN [Alphaproteobacteria bacterium]
MVDKDNLDLDSLDETEEAVKSSENEVARAEVDDNAFPAIDDEIGPETAVDLEAVYDIPVQVSAVLGKTRLPVSELLKLGTGSVVELNRKVGESIDIYVNNRLVARGEVVIVDDRLGITMTEIIKNDGK